MKITIQQHKDYLTTTFDAETELPKIVAWMDAEWRNLYLEWLANSSSKKQTEDELYWKWLVGMFVKLPAGKKTTAFVYQMLVLNGLANDGLNGKETCWRRNNDCPIVKRWLGIYDRWWQPSDLQNLCGNLAICTRIPDHKYYPFCLDFPADLQYITIDDRILTAKR